MKYGTLERLGEKLHPTEPWFTLRGQDLLAPYAIEAYATLLRAAAIGAPEMTKYRLLGAAQEVHLGAAEMLAWQAENRDLVKLPD